MVILAVMLIASASCKSKAQKDAEDYMNKIKKTVKANSLATSESEQKTSPGPFSIPQGVEKKVGGWEQQYTCYDKNGSYKLDPEEKLLREQSLVLIGAGSIAMDHVLEIKM